MKTHPHRQCLKRIPAWLVLFFAFPLWLMAEEKQELYYYLAIPSCPQKGECLFVACIQLDRKGNPVAPDPKAKAKAPFFSIWRSCYWDEQAPDAGALHSPQDWDYAVASKAERAVASKREFSELPEPIRRFFIEFEKLRSIAMQDIVMQPLFRTGGFVGWQHVKHLDVLATPATVSSGERSKNILKSLCEPREKDPAKALESNLSTLHVKTQSLRYWPEYNVFLIEAHADFKEIAETLFSPMY